MKILYGFNPSERIWIARSLQVKPVELNKVLEQRGWTKIVKKTKRVHGSCIDFGVRFDSVQDFINWLNY
jgi:hypothetical protein